MPWWAIGLLAALLLLTTEPALANKFETIGGGVAGSSGVKREWLTGFFMIAAGVTGLLGILAIVTPHRNAAFLNSTTWKQSAAVLFVLTTVSLLLAVAL